MLRPLASSYSLFLMSAGIFASSIYMTACSPLGIKTKEKKDHEQSTPDDSLWWTNRVANALSAGKTTITGQELRDLASRPQNDVIAELMARDEFTETLIRFNLEYLGFRSDDLQYPNGSLFSTQKSLAQFPQALTSAVNVKADGDFFTIFSDQQPVFAPPLSTHPLIDTEGPKSQTMEERRTAAFVHHRAMLKDLASFMKNEPDADIGRVCTRLFEKVNFNLLLNIGMPFDFFGQLAKLFGPIGRVCSEFKTTQSIPILIEASIKHWDEVEVYLKEFDPNTYKVASQNDLKTYDLVKLGFAEEATRTDEEHKLAMNWFWSALNNSSTNYNRKRASYVLKRFFCDDLTPIAVETPAVHADGQHASDPSCQACHYKLDPIAGFFRNHGMLGKDFSKEETLTFDDGATTNLETYLSNWKKPDGSWDVGYIRSINDESLNDRSAHPENPDLASLFEMIRSAPEARQCLVRTVFKYFVGDKIALDAGYIEQLSEKFSQDLAEHGSGVALKGTIKSVLTSKSFNQTNPVEDVCYDYAPGVDPSGLPPCKVARILEKNCASCHSAGNAQGGLNLFAWVEQKDGRKGFPNKDGDVDVDSMVTFQAILDRLSEPDEAKRMPLKQHMNSGDREALYLWVTHQLSGESK